MDDFPRLRRVFAARLVQARALRGLSQRELGKKMGLSKDQGFAKNTGSSRVNRYEQGTNSISLDNLEAVADALGVPPAYLVAETQQLANLVLAVGSGSFHPAHMGAAGAQDLGDDVPQLVEHLRALVQGYETALRVMAAENGRGLPPAG